MIAFADAFSILFNTQFSITKYSQSKLIEFCWAACHIQYACGLFVAMSHNAFRYFRSTENKFFPRRIMKIFLRFNSIARKHSFSKKIVLIILMMTSGKKISFPELQK